MKRIFAGLAMLIAGSSVWAAVNINTATVAELDAVKGVTPKQAAAIVDYREKNGAFKSLDELKQVKGFGEKSVAKLRTELTVGDGAPPAKEARKK